MASWRTQQYAKQARRREQNESTARTRRAAFAAADEGSFRCECGDALCLCEITLTLSEYERGRRHATYFAVARNHENPEHEHVIRENGRFAIVETVTGEATTLARRSDPRQHRGDGFWPRAARPGEPREGR